jgi:hypothetical protein
MTTIFGLASKQSSVVDTQGSIHDTQAMIVGAHAG